jgi:hypothetical protein
MKKFLLLMALFLIFEAAESRDSLLFYPVKAYYAKRRGYMGLVEFRSLIGFEKTHTRPDYCPYCDEVVSSGENNFSLGIKTVHGWRFSRWLFTGVGAGVERYLFHRQTFAPVFLQLQSEFLKRKITPFVTSEIGYSFLAQEWKDSNIKYLKSMGGIYFGATAGVRIYMLSKGSFFFHAGYVLHRSSSEWQYQYSDRLTYKIDRFYQRLNVGLGTIF